MEDTRCEISTTVGFHGRCASALRSAASVAKSSAEALSSRMRMAGLRTSARAIVSADGLVRALLDVHELIPVKLTAEVDGHALGAHMKADVIVAVLTVDKPGDNVLARVVLHPAQALLSIETAGNGQPRLERSVSIVQYLAAALLHIDDAHGADIPGVGKLASALGEESRPIKDHRPAALFPAAIEHLGFKGKHMAVDIIKLLSRHLHCSNRIYI